MPPRKPYHRDELERLAAQIVDGNVDNGAFSSLTTHNAMAWIMALGHISDIDPRMDQAVTPKKQREIAVENLRLGLWDVQRSVEKKSTVPRTNFYQDSITSSLISLIPRPRIST
jgi:hypothetical protein